MLKFVYIENFELILDIPEHPKPSMLSFKQPASLLFEKTPMSKNIICNDTIQTIFTIEQRENVQGSYASHDTHKKSYNA